MLVMQVFDATKATLNFLAHEVEQEADADLMSITGAIEFALDNKVRAAAESFDTKKQSIFIVLDTPGGLTEVVERIVRVIRHHWEDVTFCIPDYALSAGTILALSGDRILMDYFSMLGPIDPQVQRGGKLVPALSYLTQYDRILKKFQANQGTTAELQLLAQLDLAELHQFEEARELTRELLKKWLATYKFKDWLVTETRQVPVDDEMRQTRAEEIATALADHQRWHSHGRGIYRDVLVNELGLRIDDLEAQPDLASKVGKYHRFLLDMLSQGGSRPSNFVHTIGYL